uniref:Uncharacterized protein n=1 Tax=Trichobilharzia regenti TaxID=157069 RepID=A0AA85IL66_TRIRE|nr:unnamed protein product [Trichobilharzia regenti]
MCGDIFRFLGILVGQYATIFVRLDDAVGLSARFEFTRLRGVLFRPFTPAHWDYLAASPVLIKDLLNVS